MYYVLIYEGVENYEEARKPFRPDHLALAREFYDRGELVQAGGFADPVNGSLLVFRSETPDVPFAFARRDPFVIRGLVKNWTVHRWTTIVGPDATVPTFGI